MADQNNMNMEHEQFDYDFDTLSMVSDDSGYYTISFLTFLPRWFTPVFYPRPNPDQKTITEQKNNFIFRSRIKSSVNLPKYLQMNKKGFKFELKNSKRQKTKWIKMDRTKAGRTKNGPETKTDRKWCIIRSITYLISIFSWVKNSYQSNESYIMSHILSHILWLIISICFIYYFSWDGNYLSGMSVPCYSLYIQIHARLK